MSWYDNQPVDLGSDIVIKRSEFKALLTEELWDAVRLWKDYKRFGLPHGSGQQSETSEYIELIGALEDEYDDLIAQKRQEAFKT